MTYDDARVIAIAISGDFQENSKQKLIFSIFKTEEKSLKELKGNSNFDQLVWVALIYERCQSFFPKDVFCAKGFQDLFKQAAQVFFDNFNQKQGTKLKFSDFDAVFAHSLLLSELDLKDENADQIIDTILNFSKSEDSSSVLSSTHPWKVAFYKLKALHKFLKINKCDATMSFLQEIGQIKGDLSSVEKQSRIQKYLENVHGEYRRLFQPTPTPKDLNALSKVLFIYVIDFISKESDPDQIDSCRDQVIKYVLEMLGSEVTYEDLINLYEKAKEDLAKDIQDDSHFNDHSSQESSVYLKALAIAKFKGYLSNLETELDSAPELEPEPEPEPEQGFVADLTQHFESRPLDSDNERGLLLQQKKQSTSKARVQFFETVPVNVVNEQLTTMEDGVMLDAFMQSRLNEIFTANCHSVSDSKSKVIELSKLFFRLKFGIPVNWLEFCDDLEFKSTDNKNYFIQELKSLGRQHAPNKLC